MDIGIGLQPIISGVRGRLILDWAAAGQAGLSILELSAVYRAPLAVAVADRERRATWGRLGS